MAGKSHLRKHLRQLLTSTKVAVVFGDTAGVQAVIANDKVIIRSDIEINVEIKKDQLVSKPNPES